MQNFCLLSDFRFILYPQLESNPYKKAKLSFSWLAPHGAGQMGASQKCSRLGCLLCVKGLVICFLFGLVWQYSSVQTKCNKGRLFKSWLLTCISNITLSLLSHTGSALKGPLKRELNFCNGYLSLLYF